MCSGFFFVELCVVKIYCVKLLAFLVLLRRRHGICYLNNNYVPWFREDRRSWFHIDCKRFNLRVHIWRRRHVQWVFSNFLAFLFSCLESAVLVGLAVHHSVVPSRLVQHILHTFATENKIIVQLSNGIFRKERNEL